MLALSAALVESRPSYCGVEMSEDTTRRDVAARKGDVTVKLNGEVVRIAKIVASVRRQSLAEYLSVTFLPVVQADLERELKRELDQSRKGRKSE
jgi:hypothetical protein